MPAAMNTMLEPSSSSLMRAVSSKAACRPVSGLAPAPSPLVTEVPMASLFGTFSALSACRSVFMATNSTPGRLLFTMC